MSDILKRVASEGNHTCPIIHHYIACPKCHFINESRTDYERRLNLYQKDITCERCKHSFTYTKPN